VFANTGYIEYENNTNKFVQTKMKYSIEELRVEGI